MSLLDKLKSLLGLGGSTSGSRDERDVGVTVERERERDRRTDASTERAVKESPGDSAGETQAEPSESTPDDSTEETSPEDGEGTEAGSGTEPETGDGADESGTGSAQSEEDEDRVPSEAVDVIKGIGPTYAGRLADAGFETVDDLAAADPEDVSDRADVPAGRVENWIEQAKARTR